VTDVGPVHVEFLINDVATVPVDIVAATTGARPALTLAAGPAEWETIDLLQLFNLRWDVRHDGAVSGGQPVQIVVALDPEIDAGELPGTPDELAAFVAAAGARDEQPWRDSQRWFALEVTEQIDLPAELAALGEVRSGFTTSWGDAPAAS